MAVNRVFVFWFRRDLRLEDNRGFAFALREAEKTGAKVLPFFIFDQSILKRLEDQDDARVTFIHKTLTNIKSQLEEQGSDLLCAYGEPRKVWKNLLSGELTPGRRLEITGVAFNHDYEPSAIARDGAIERLLAQAEIPLETFKDQVVFERAEVIKDDGRPYTVFTPFSKKWLSRLEANPDELRAETCSLNQKSLFQGRMPPLPTVEEIGFTPNITTTFPAKSVDSKLLSKYAAERDVPALMGTSRLGLHLRFGTVSVRRLVKQALKLNARVWINELVWREFFMQILWHFPHVVEHAFRPEFDRIVWRNREAEFQAWCQGKTGYPLVDAGMRELDATGFMHNRVRMVAASFLIKHLLIDWRWGEAYFARRLLDYELSSNNGNWQWVAGSGCDAAPYFRVFNPELQLKKFDPSFAYVRKWLPEYGTEKYPSPIIEHAEARARALHTYASIKTRS